MQYPPCMKELTVGIIGIQGQYGQWLKSFFERMGHYVIGSGRSTAVTNAEVVKRSDVVIFSVPIRVTVSVIEELIEHSRPEQLWMDVTSVKARPIESMLKSEAEVVGLHPMCAPTLESLKGQVMVRCDARLDKWREFVERFCEASEAKIKVMSPEDHDKMMATIQVLPHASILSMASVLKEHDVNVHEMLECTSAFYKITWSLMGRILAQRADLYADIQMENPSSVEVLRNLEDSIRALRERVEAGDRAAFIEAFDLSAEHIGQDELKGGFDIFEELIHYLSD